MFGWKKSIHQSHSIGLRQRFFSRTFLRATNMKWLQDEKKKQTANEKPDFFSLLENKWKFYPFPWNSLQFTFANWRRRKVKRVTTLLFSLFKLPVCCCFLTRLHAFVTRTTRMLFKISFCMEKCEATQKRIYQPHTRVFRRRFGWTFFDHPHIVVIDRLLFIQLFVVLRCFAHFFFNILSFFRFLFSFILRLVCFSHCMKRAKALRWQNAIKMLHRGFDINFNLEQMHFDSFFLCLL